MLFLTQGAHNAVPPSSPLHDALAKRRGRGRTPTPNPVPTDTGLIADPKRRGGVVVKEDDATLVVSTPPEPVAQTPVVATSRRERWWRYAVNGLNPMHTTTDPKLVCVSRDRSLMYAVAVGRVCRTRQGLTKDYIVCSGDELFSTPEEACLAFDEHTGDATPWDVEDNLPPGGLDTLNTVTASWMGRTVLGLMLYAFRGVGLEQTIAETDWTRRDAILVVLTGCAMPLSSSSPRSLTRLTMGCIEYGLRVGVVGMGDDLLLTFTKDEQPTLWDTVAQHTMQDGDPVEGMTATHGVHGLVTLIEATAHGYLCAKMTGIDAGQVVLCDPNDMRFTLEEDDG